MARAEAGAASTTALVQGITAFGHDAYVQAAKTPGNVVFSPLSIAIAMSMARAGAGGTTASQIDAAMHFPAADRDAAVNALTLDLATRDSAPPVSTASRSADGPPPDPIVTVANGLFVQQGQPIGAAFLHTMAADYGSGVHTVDFGAQQATDEINAWVKAHTADRIQKLFDSLDASTKLVLADAVYLKADWQTPMVEDPVTEAPFTTASGQRVTASTMHLTAMLRYASGPTWQAVEIPYAGDTLAMWVMLPQQDATLADLLAPTTLTSIGGALQPTSVGLSLPRWKTTTDLDLVKLLHQLGITAAFGAGADFSGIYPGLSISQAVHRATITVDEWGTEAAAVTGLAFAVSKLANPVPMDVDHPFAYAIVQKKTGAILFEGSVADPTAG